MKLIPVIDLKAGEVVHARRGDRDNYRPIVSPLCRGSRPEDGAAPASCHDPSSPAEAGGGAALCRDDSAVERASGRSMRGLGRG